jgi:phosphorylcholine metabolism protein LicD
LHAFIQKQRERAERESLAELTAVEASMTASNRNSATTSNDMSHMTHDNQGAGISIDLNQVNIYEKHQLIKKVKKKTYICLFVVKKLQCLQDINIEQDNLEGYGDSNIPNLNQGGSSHAPQPTNPG